MSRAERRKLINGEGTGGGQPIAAAHDFDALVHALGNRVKRLRARRGMSRKLLSDQSGVSERYLAQLESGKANVSFQVLLSIAGAMNIALTDLLTDREDETPDLLLAKRFLETLSADQQVLAYSVLKERFAPDRQRKGVVALVGLRGAGKTTLGDRLAQHYSVPFVRLGGLVEQTAGIDIAEIFLTMGQKGYRRLEYGALQQAVTHHPRAVIETGGSIVSEPRTFDLLLDSCFTVWLKATPEEHMNRVVQQGDMRPMEGNRRAMDDLENILVARSAFYSRADASIDTSGRTIDDCAQELQALCRPHLGTAERAVV